MPQHQHPDDAAVDQLAARMKARLAKKRAEGRAGWDNKALCSAETLSLMCWGALYRNDLLDAMNLLMMIDARGDRLDTGINESES